jgi:hypothetical protein
MQTNKNLIPSGLYYTFYRVEFIPELELESIDFDMDLAKDHFREYYDESCVTEDDIDEIVEREFYDKVSMYNTYYRLYDCDYNEENAYKCNLIPFEIITEDEDKYYLAYVSGRRGEASPNLDAYYFLQTGNMDPSSMYFSLKECPYASGTNKDYFKSLMSDEIFNAIEAKFGGVK